MSPGERLEVVAAPSDKVCEPGHRQTVGLTDPSQPDDHGTDALTERLSEIVGVGVQDIRHLGPRHRVCSGSDHYSWPDVPTVKLAVEHVLAKDDLAIGVV